MKKVFIHVSCTIVILIVSLIAGCSPNKDNGKIKDAELKLEKSVLLKDLNNFNISLMSQKTETRCPRWLKNTLIVAAGDLGGVWVGSKGGGFIGGFFGPQGAVVGAVAGGIIGGVGASLKAADGLKAWMDDPDEPFPTNPFPEHLRNPDGTLKINGRILLNCYRANELTRSE